MIVHHVLSLSYMLLTCEAPQPCSLRIAIPAFNRYHYISNLTTLLPCPFPLTL